MGRKEGGEGGEGITRSLTHSLNCSIAHAHTHTHLLTLTLTHTHTHSHTQTITHTHNHSVTHSHNHSQSYTLTHSLITHRVHIYGREELVARLQELAAELPSRGHAE
jgi:hypothetical protein